MSAAAGSEARERPAKQRRVSPRVVGIAVLVLVLAAMAIDTTYKKPGETTASGREAFDPASYGEETFPKAVSTLEQSAVPIAKLHAALRKDPDAAGEQYGKRQGSSPVQLLHERRGSRRQGRRGPDARAGQGRAEGRQGVAAGRARDQRHRDPRRRGFIEFGQFTNQVEYAAAATALNTKVKEDVLKGLDPASLEGERVSFLGAFSLVTPDVVTITPVRLEAA